jgi:predicted dehydrogenase
MRYRSAIIGCGKIGSDNALDPRIKDISTHAGAYVDCLHTDLVAICDINSDKLERCGKIWNVPNCYQDYQKMLIEIQPDIVSICTPDKTHYSIILHMLKTSQVKAIFAEKPLTIYLEEALEIVNFAEKKEILIAVNYSRRYSPIIINLKKALKGGSLGKIMKINGYYTKGTIHNGTHWFDLACFLVGDIVKVQGYDILKETEPDPTYDVLIEFDNGANGYLHACDTTKFSIFEMDIIGTAGRIILKEFGHILEIYNVSDSPYNTGFKSLIFKDTQSNVMNNLLLYAVEDIVQCLQQRGKIPVCSGKDGVASLKIACSVRDSVKTGKAIMIGLSNEKGEK